MAVAGLDFASTLRKLKLRNADGLELPFRVDVQSKPCAASPWKRGVYACRAGKFALFNDNFLLEMSRVSRLTFRNATMAATSQSCSRQRGFHGAAARHAFPRQTSEHGDASCHHMQLSIALCLELPWFR